MLTTVLILLPLLALGQAASKIGYVDLKRLIDDAPQMIEARAKLQREFAPRDARLKDDEARLARLKQRYDRDGAIMTRADAEALAREIDVLEHAVKRGREDLRKEFDTRAAAERDRIWQVINDAVIDYARSQGFDLIIPSPVVYVSPRIDITDAVLERLRQSKPAAEGNP